MIPYNFISSMHIFRKQTIISINEEIEIEIVNFSLSKKNSLENLNYTNNHKLEIISLVEVVIHYTDDPEMETFRWKIFTRLYEHTTKIN